MCGSQNVQSIGYGSGNSYVIFAPSCVSFQLGILNNTLLVLRFMRLYI